MRWNWAPKGPNLDSRPRKPPIELSSGLSTRSVAREIASRKLGRNFPETVVFGPKWPFWVAPNGPRNLGFEMLKNPYFLPLSRRHRLKNLQVVWCKTRNGWYHYLCRIYVLKSSKNGLGVFGGSFWENRFFDFFGPK